MIPANNELIKPSTDFIKSGLAINLKSINIKKQLSKEIAKTIKVKHIHHHGCLHKLKKKLRSLYQPKNVNWKKLNLSLDKMMKEDELKQKRTDYLWGQVRKHVLTRNTVNIFKSQSEYNNKMRQTGSASIDIN